MPAFSHIATASLIPAAIDLFTNARDNKEIAAALAPFGYDKDDYDAGLALADALRDAMKLQATEEGQKITATRLSDLATAALRAAFVTHRSRARRAHPRGTPGYDILNLRGSVPEGEDRLLAAARHFYETLQTSPDLTTPIRNLAGKTVTDALALLTTAERAESDQTRETGESERASALRAFAEDALRDAAADLAADAEDALTPYPQLREVLGLYQPGN